MIDDRKKLSISIKDTSILSINRHRCSVGLVLRGCFEDTQMRRQIEFFPDVHLLWMSQKE